jgi:DNA polymerase-3 subunit epsilon
MDRLIVLDTETTGLEVNLDHRIIEVGCIELRHRRYSGIDFHRYVNPQRAIDVGAQEVHGISAQFLADKPVFADIAGSLREYLTGAELVIHNAAFDLGFLDAEFARCGYAEPLNAICKVTDSLLMARRLHPGQKASLDALCKRYGVDNSRRDYHGALLDARLLADVYLAMTGGQSILGLGASTPVVDQAMGEREADVAMLPLVVVHADPAERTAHDQRLEVIRKKAGRLFWTDASPVVPAISAVPAPVLA